MEEELRNLIFNTEAVADIVGRRVEWIEHPQGSGYPAIVLNVVSGFEGIHMNGKGPFEGRVQVDCYGMTYTAAKSASRSVIEALNGYRGDGFLFISNTSTRDSREGGSNEADRPFRTGLDFNITWRPT